MSKKIIGVDLGGTNIRLGLIENGNVINFHSNKISSRESSDFVLEEIISAINKIFIEEVEGIGIGVPSIVDIKSGVVYEVHNIPSWIEVPLKKIIEERFSVPVEINNDVNCFVLGEKYFGKGKDFKDVVGLALGTGLGGGIIINGRLYSGRNGGAGEFGLMKYKDRNYEFYCSGQFFKELYGKNGEDVLVLAKKNDRKALQIFEQFGKNIGDLINSVMYALNPEVIIFGGSVSNSYKYFEKSMMDVIDTYEFKTQLKDIKIEKSELEHVSILGASMLLNNK